MSFLGTWFVTAIATFVALWITPGITVVGGVYAGPIFTALILSLLNASIKPILKLLSLPLTIISLGIFSLFINAFVLELASYFSRNIFHQGIAIQSFGSAFIGAIIISLTTTIVSGIIS